MPYIFAFVLLVVQTYYRINTSIINYIFKYYMKKTEQLNY